MNFSHSERFAEEIQRQISLTNWEFESHFTAVSSRWDTDNQAWDNMAQTPLRVLLEPYLKWDFYIRYKATDSLNFFTRFENVTNTKYEEIRDYSTAGPSLDAGVSYSW